MKAEQLSQRIGNVEESMLEEAARFSRTEQDRKKKWLRRAGAMAAALVLMVGSFSAGALVWAKEPETVTIVKEPETVVFGDSGISLILPDSWAGKYGVSEREWEGGYGIEIYQLASHNEFEKYGNGAVVRLSCYEQEYSIEEEFPYRAHVIAVRDGRSYVISQPSDVQCMGEDEVWDEYLAMEESVPQIKVLLSNWLQENSFNSTNWKEGTVTVDLYDKNKYIKKFFCDEEHSEAIREIAQAQDYSLELKSFYYDAWLSFGTEEYIVSLETGDIEKNGFGRAQLSEEDLTKLKALLEEAESTSISQPGS